MKQKQRIMLGVLLVAVIALGWLLLSPSREPRYGGRSLSHWFKEFCRSGSDGISDPDRYAKAAFALRQIGTNAVPYMLDQAFSTNKDSAARTNLIRFMNSFPPSLGLPIVVRTEISTDYAREALRIIKPPADLLLPRVEKELKSTNIWQHNMALAVLGLAGDGAEQSVPYLTAALKENRSRLSQLVALHSLIRLGPKASGAVPSLMELMPTNAWAVNWIIPLGYIGSNAAPALPLIREQFMKATNWHIDEKIATALVRIDAGETDALNYLIENLKTTNRYHAASQLGEIGPNARAAVPALIEALRGTNVVAARALISIGAPKESFLPLMKEILKSGNAGVRLAVAEYILAIEPANHDAHAVLLEQANEKSTNWSTALVYLRRAGPAASNTIPALRELLKTGDKTFRAAVARTLKSIEAKEPEK